ncbi:hypothetical protein H2508_04570 [Parahaliea sp. F7430]|uniref:Uncharacterized protein n=1 Tax=Sediminihaliea albiluteola TaxID=2758564 RepID=A0A7W2TUU8_9GAMM|nr:hypothetical protein [Sediminihaliea albiluteola]MBA6412380.1 hypothetical protein [Sediminihaliea albiluteola]
MNCLNLAFGQRKVCDGIYYGRHFAVKSIFCIQDKRQTLEWEVTLLGAGFKSAGYKYLGKGGPSTPLTNKPGHSNQLLKMNRPAS